MCKMYKRSVFLVLLNLTVSILGFAQRPSPPAQAQCTFSDGKIIATDYSSPRMKGRKIFGGVVPYGQVFRTGANEATTFVTTTNLIIGGKNVPAGSYTIFTIPSEAQWILIINKKTGEWGGPYQYESDELTRIDMHVSQTASVVENFTIAFDPKGESCTLTISWENTQASVQITEITPGVHTLSSASSVQASNVAAGSQQWSWWAADEKDYPDIAIRTRCVGDDHTGNNTRWEIEAHNTKSWQIDLRAEGKKFKIAPQQILSLPSVPAQTCRSSLNLKIAGNVYGNSHRFWVLDYQDGKLTADHLELTDSWMGTMATVMTGVAAGMSGSSMTSTSSNVPQPIGSPAGSGQEGTAPCLKHLGESCYTGKAGTLYFQGCVLVRDPKDQNGCACYDKAKGEYCGRMD